MILHYLLIAICMLIGVELNAMDKLNELLENPNLQKIVIQAPKVILNLAHKNNTTVINKNDIETTSQSSSQATATATNFIHLVQKTLQPLPHQMQEWASLHKKHLFTGTAVAAYVACAAILIEGNYYMNREESWGKWKHHLSVEELQHYALDNSQKQELTRHLITTILNRYFKMSAPTNHLEPLVTFMQSLHKETALINRYITLATFLQKAHVIRIFPTNSAKIAQAKAYKQRLDFIKQLFITSMASYNLNQLLRPVAAG